MADIGDESMVGNEDEESMAEKEDEESTLPAFKMDNNINLLLSLADEDAPIDPLIQMFKDKGVFSEQDCSYCNTAMRWIKDCRKIVKGDGYYWKCHYAQCENRYCSKSIRDGTIFSKSKLEMKQWLKILVQFSIDGSVLELNKITKTSRKSIAAAFHTLRSVISHFFDEHPVYLGGEGKICHIDETCFGHQRKKKRCTKCPVWVFGIVDRSRTPEVGYMEIVDKRDSATVQSIIKRVCLPGTIIYSDDCPAYRSIQDNLGFNHKIIYKNYDLVDTETIVHPQVVEDYWKKHKRQLARMRGAEPDELKLHLHEAMFRERTSGNMMNALFDVIALANTRDGYSTYTKLEERTKKQVLKNENRIANESNSEEVSNIENRENYCKEKEARKIKYVKPIKIKIEGNADVVYEPPIKKLRPSSPLNSIDQQEGHGNNNINDTIDQQDPETESETSMLNIINFFQQHKLLNDEVKCDYCDDLMMWKESSKTPGKAWPDMFFWKCENSSCPCFDETNGKSIKEGSIFARSKLSLSKWYDIMYLWSEHITSKSSCDHMNISKQTAIDCYKFFREVCSVYLKANPIRIGGNMITIDVEQYGQDMWVLCIVDNSCNPRVGYMELLRSNDAFTIYQIIRRVVRPGSIIHSKDWRIYRKIQGLPDMGIVKHTVNFIDVGISLQTDPNDSYWMKYKNTLKFMKGNNSKYINSYLHEFMWRERFSNNALENLCKQIADQSHDFPHMSSTGFSPLEEAGENINGQDRLPQNKFHQRLEQGAHSDIHNRLAQNSMCTDSDNVAYSEASYSGEEMGNHERYLEVQLQENESEPEPQSEVQIEENVDHSMDLMTRNKELMTKKNGDRQRSWHNKIRNYYGEPEHTKDQDPEPEYEAEPEHLSESELEHELQPQPDVVIDPDSTAPKQLIYAIEWFQKHQLLKTKISCNCCNNYMTWADSGKTDRKKKIFDVFFWKCETKSCPGRMSGKSIRDGSLFSKSKLSLLNWYDIMFFWSMSFSVKAASDELKISTNCITRCYDFFREICEVYFMNNPVKLGGPGIPIEVDVCNLSSEEHRKKNGPWVFCMAETNSTPTNGYMEKIDTRDAATLLVIINKIVQPGSVILCKEWREYPNLKALSVNSSFRIVDANTYGGHTSGIEEYWNKFKSNYKAMKGGRLSNMSAYLHDFMWHERFSENSFEALCQQIAARYVDNADLDMKI